LLRQRNALHHDKQTATECIEQTGREMTHGDLIGRKTERNNTVQKARKLTTDLSTTTPPLQKRADTNKPHKKQEHTNGYKWT
jgi:hypothetical protein